ncbi:MAG: hypothetical protein ABGW77_06525 [Campylobacterales bacterium]
MEELKILKFNHGKEVLKTLLSFQIPFRTVVINSGLNYNPPLPREIGEELNRQQVLIFEFSNYTLQNAHLEQDNLVFETGFGPQNFGSVVTIPIWRITTIGLINPALGIFVNPFSEEKPPSTPQRSGRLILR